jgi:thiol-disulfide isomerase/thioredoxin
MKQLYILIVFLLSVQVVNSQNKLVYGKLEGFEEGTTLYLKRFFGATEQKIDSAIVDKNGSFSFNNIKQLKSGLHHLSIKKYNALFPISKQDKSLEIEASLTTLSNGKLNIKNSKEQLAFNELLEIYYTIEAQKDSIINVFKTANRFDKKYKAKSEEFNAFITEKSKSINKILETFTAKYPNTYSSEVLVPLLIIPYKEFSVSTDTMYDTKEAYLHYHFFDYINFKDEATINNSLFEEKILEYFKLYIMPTQEGIKEGIDILVKKTSANIVVKEFVVGLMLNLLSQTNNLEVAEYLIKNYYTDGCDSNLKPEVLGMLENLKKLIPGKPAPDIELIDVNSKRIKLSEVKNKKVILLYFWSSGCGFCKEATPKLKELYSKYKKDGLEIFAVSLDNNFVDWNTYLENNALEWVNVSELKGWQSRVVETYSVTGTPTYFLLDGNHKIISRQSTFDGCKKLVEELF